MQSLFHLLIVSGIGYDPVHGDLITGHHVEAKLTHRPIRLALLCHAGVHWLSLCT